MSERCVAYYFQVNRSKAKVARVELRPCPPHGSLRMLNSHDVEINKLFAFYLGAF